MSNYFWLGADGEVTECTEEEFLALVSEERREMDKFKALEPSRVDEHAEQYSFWGIEDDGND